MKKILFATTAIAASTAAGVAFASERATGAVNGYMFMGAGLSDANASGETEVGVLRDSEIHLTYRGSSDNGLTFDGRIELEAFTTGDQIDENWARVSGSFGSVLIGSNDTAGDNFGDVGILYAPGARLAYYDGFGVTPTAFSDDAGDSLGLRYATPNISGFTAAVSYHPNAGTDGGNDTGYGFASRGPQNAVIGQGTSSTAANGKDVVSLAANYAGDFDAFSFAIGGDYTFADGGIVTGAGVAQDISVYSVGAEVGFSGFTLGLHYEGNDGAEEQDWVIGAQYQTGPWTIAGGYSYSDIDNGPDIDTFAGWVTYALAPGVVAAAGLEYGDSGNVDAYNALTYLAISF